MRFLVDNQLPAALAVLLREQGHEAEHVLDLGLAQGKDNPIWQHAITRQAVIITKDEDFAEWSAPRPPRASGGVVAGWQHFPTRAHLMARPVSAGHRR